MEAAAQNGASDEEIAQTGMPMTPEDFFAMVFSGAFACRGETAVAFVASLPSATMPNLGFS